MDDLYKELDLPSDCSFEDIKQQFRILARVHHPDMGGDEEKFKKIKFAYEVLSDPDRRAEYDRTGNTQNSPDISHLARQNLSSMFLAILPNFDPNNGDILEIIRNEIHKSMDNMTNDKNTSNVFISKLELVKNKIRKKDNDSTSDNLFDSFISSQFEAKTNHLNDMDKRIEIGKEMLKILDEYTYGFIEIPKQGGGFKYIEGENNINT